MMRAVVCEGHGGAEVLTVGERPLPVPGEGEILIKVEYSALNRADIMQRKGAYPPPPGVTDVLGLECLGRVVTANPGTVNEEFEGDRRVIALLPGGGYAKYVKVRADHCITVPNDYDTQKAACFMEVWCTAY